MGLGLGDILTIGGGVVGGIVGGPQGALTGASLGGTLGGIVDRDDPQPSAVSGLAELPGVEIPSFEFDQALFDDALAQSGQLFGEARGEAGRLFSEAQAGAEQQLAPFRQAGVEQIPGLTAGISNLSQEAQALNQDIQAGQFDPRNLSFTAGLDSPEFQSLLAGGTRAIDQASAAQGLLGSGARLKDLTSFGQEAVNKFTGDVLNRRLGLSGNLLGQRTTGLGALAAPLQAQQNLFGAGLDASRLLSSGLLSGAQSQSGLLGNLAQSQSGLLGSLAGQQADLGLRGQQLALQGQLGVQDNALRQQALAQELALAEQKAESQQGSKIGQILGGVAKIPGLFGGGGATTTSGGGQSALSGLGF